MLTEDHSLDSLLLLPTVDPLFLRSFLQVGSCTFVTKILSGLIGPLQLEPKTRRGTRHEYYFNPSVASESKNYLTLTAMAHRQGIWVYLYKGSEGEPFPHFSKEGVNCSNVYVQASPWDRMSIRLHITRQFAWKDSNALLLEIRLDSAKPLIALPVPRDPDGEAISLDIDDWPVWMPDSHKSERGGCWKKASFLFQEMSKAKVWLQSSIQRNHRCLILDLGRINWRG